MSELYISRLIFTRMPYKSLSKNAKWLYVVLKELECRYDNEYGSGKGFFCTNEQLASDSGMSLSTLKRAKAELLTVSLAKCEQRHKIINEGKPTQKLPEQAFSWWYAIK